jgi:hypothetical protein
MYDNVAALRRRHAAAARMPGGDPLSAAERALSRERERERTESLTEQALDGWVAASRHLMSLGYPPVVPMPVLRALWRRRADRELALMLARIQGAAA